VTDEGSKNKTFNIVKNISDKRISYINNKSNQNTDFSRNIGIKDSKSKLIVF
jgi:hypothetical protein